MPVEVVKADLFSYPCHVKVCTVNTVGAMGAGVARQYRDRWPMAYARYRKRCLAGDFTVTDLLVQRCGSEWWVLFPTKQDWRNGSELAWIETNLTKLGRLCFQYNVKRIALPWLGCANGGLDRNDVLPLIKAAFDHHSTTCVIIDR